MRLRQDWTRSSGDLDPDLARRVVVLPGRGADRSRTEKLLLKRDYREVMVPE